MSTVQRTKTYAVCPHCGKDAGCVDHLLGREIATRWSCDHCGGGYSLTFTVDGSVVIAPTVNRVIKTLDVLVLEPQLSPVYFVVEGMRFEPVKADSDTSEHEHKQFYYEEHSCPTNWFEPKMVYFEGDSDPHGLLKFVTHVDADALPPDQDVGPNDHDAALVALIESHIAAKP